MSRRITPLLLALALASCRPGSPPAPRDVSPVDGTSIVGRMHAAYEGRWFRTLTFTQITTLVAAGGAESKQTWHEAASAPGRLRIDVGEPALGNGMLYTIDSGYVVREGKVVRRMPSGNPFLPFVVGIYTQPVEASVHDIGLFGFDLSRVHERMWEGKRVYVVGASSEADDRSPQFWVEQDRLITVRVLLPAGTGPVQDIRLERYVQLGQSWLATHVAMLIDGKPRQLEDYMDYRIDVPLSTELFQAEHWKDAVHWRP